MKCRVADAEAAWQGAPVPRFGGRPQTLRRAMARRPHFFDGRRGPSQGRFAKFLEAKICPVPGHQTAEPEHLI